jgi:hypothetical protein
MIPIHRTGQRKREFCRLLGERFRSLLLLGVILILSTPGYGQVDTASVSGIVTDESGGIVVGAEVRVTNSDTNITSVSISNQSGVYLVSGLRPGRYRIKVTRDGFKGIDLTDLVLNVQDAVNRNFTLQVGSVSESVSVEGNGLQINAQDASVSTVIDRQFVDNLPLNGRSFNTLLQLTPGVVIPPTTSEGGQFSISGQRTNANYFQVDGASVNFGVGTNEVVTQSGSGAVQAFNAFGGTSSLVSVDAMQEFRIETSSFAPEFGRAPGGQVIITTRSGTNDFHGDIFDYFRNDVLDANDWFANRAGLPRAPERQNDFGGVLGGPILRGKTFFFLSYEGLRLRQPQTAVIQVPSLSLRSSAIPAAAAYLDAYPLPNGPVSNGGNTAQFTGNYSNQITADAGSFRLDHTLNDRLSIFGRFNWAPSEIIDRPATATSGSVSELQTIDVNTKTFTGGLNAQITHQMTNTLRLNYSAQDAGTNYALDSFEGATPPSSNFLIPSPLTTSGGVGIFSPFFGPPSYFLGKNSKNKESQWNVVEDLSIIKGTHQLKVGVDYRRLLLNTSGHQIAAQYFVFDPNQFAASATADFVFNQVIHPGKVSFRAFSTYAQDSWSIARRLTLTYGLRWEVNPSPTAKGGTVIASWQNVDVPANTVLAPAGTAPWKTTYANFAPRVGIAYRLTPDGDFVLRAGWGMFYDVGTGTAGNLLGTFPDSATALVPGVPLPIADAASIAPSFSTQPPYGGIATAINGFSPNLQLPYSHQWNVALEKSFWGQQALSLTYVGQAGRRLLRIQQENQPNSNFAPGTTFTITGNGDTSDYGALQIQYRRPMAKRVQALLNYTWSHSIDTNSSDSVFYDSLIVIPAQANRGSSDFDVRHNLTGALTYDLPSIAKKSWVAAVVGNWSLATVFQARTGFPVQVNTSSVAIPGSAGNPSRPDLVGGPVWLSGPQYPGGMALNPLAFGLPSTPRQGTLGRNSIYGFGATQFDVSVQRKFKLAERFALEFRTDAFNIFNHPNFANPDGTFSVTSGVPAFAVSGGESAQMLNHGIFGLNPLYQIGGPRSLQLSLKLQF